MTLQSISGYLSFEKKAGKVGEGDDCKMTLARFPGSIIESARLRSRPCMETRKRRDDRFKISSIHYFFPFSPAFSPPCSCSLFSTNFFSHAFLNHYSHIIFTMKNREIEITVQKSKKYRLSSIHLINSKRISGLQRRID